MVTWLILLHKIYACVNSTLISFKVAKFNVCLCYALIKCIYQKLNSDFLELGYLFNCVVYLCECASESECLSVYICASVYV